MFSTWKMIFCFPLCRDLNYKRVLKTHWMYSIGCENITFPTEQYFWYNNASVWFVELFQARKTESSTFYKVIPTSFLFD